MKITISKEFYAWQAALAMMAEGGSHAREWQAATDVMFSRTQEMVHVLSGDLKSSGRVEVTESRGVVTGTITYGGGVVDYAVDEINRGGSHDYLTPAFVASQKTFEKALMDSIISMTGL